MHITVAIVFLNLKRNDWSYFSVPNAPKHLEHKRIMQSFSFVVQQKLFHLYSDELHVRVNHGVTWKSCDTEQMLEKTKGLYICVGEEL